MAKQTTDHARIQKLLTGYVSNNLSQADYHELMDYILLSETEDSLHQVMDQVWNIQPAAPAISQDQSELMYKRMISDQRFNQAARQKTASTHRLWYRVAAVAVVLLCLTAGLLYHRSENSAPSELLARHDISPGSNKAILTLGDGTKVVLTDAGNGPLAKQAGVNITKTADGQLVYQMADQGNTIKTYNTIETPRGGQYQVNLPDGTKIWMNSASKLKFPASFSSSAKRKVELTGEAYFEVAHNPDQPFIVSSNHQEVEVLGTHFNINSYPDEPGIKTTLLEGSVRVNQSLLKPGQQSVLTAGSISVHTADLETTMAWKNGYFIFKDEDLPGIMRKISRWYDVDIVYPESLASKHFEGSVSRFKNVSEVLRKFELTGNIHFKIEGRRITAMP